MHTHGEVHTRSAHTLGTHKQGERAIELETRILITGAGFLISRRIARRIAFKAGQRNHARRPVAREHTGLANGHLRLNRSLRSISVGFELLSSLQLTCSIRLNSSLQFETPFAPHDSCTNKLEFSEQKSLKIMENKSSPFDDGAGRSAISERFYLILFARGASFLKNFLGNFFPKKKVLLVLFELRRSSFIEEKISGETRIEASVEVQ